MYKVLGTLAVLLIAIKPAPCQDMTFGSTRLTLGTPQDSALTKLRAVYRVDSVKDENNSFLIYSKDGPPFTVLGSLGFKDHKLTYISREWEPEGKATGASFAVGIYGALAQMVEEKNTACAIATSEKMNPQLEVKSIQLNCGPKSIQITIFKGKDFEDSANITEVLRASEQVP